MLAVNPALGVIAHVDLSREAATFTRRFRAADGGSATGALTANGRRLYFASGRNVWSYDVTRRRLRGPRVAPLPIVGFGFGRDGRRVYAARSDGSVVTVDTRNGA